MQRSVELDYFPIDKLAKSLPFEGRIWGFEALSEIYNEVILCSKGIEVVLRVINLVYGFESLYLD